MSGLARHIADELVLVPPRNIRPEGGTPQHDTSRSGALAAKGAKIRPVAGPPQA